jgi:hypothetical protein
VRDGRFGEGRCARPAAAMAVAVMESMASLTERALAEQAGAALNASPPEYDPTTGVQRTQHGLAHDGSDNRSHDTLSSLRGTELDASSTKQLKAAPSSRAPSSRRLATDSSKKSLQSVRSMQSSRSVQSKMSSKSGQSKDASKSERVPGLQPSFPGLLAPRGTVRRRVRCKPPATPNRVARGRDEEGPARGGAAARRRGVFERRFAQVERAKLGLPPRLSELEDVARRAQARARRPRPRMRIRPEAAALPHSELVRPMVRCKQHLPPSQSNDAGSSATSSSPRAC